MSIIEMLRFPPIGKLAGVPTFCYCQPMPARLGIQKTYKLFLGGKFPRTESGRFYEFFNEQGEFVANVSWGSPKDFRNAVVAARGAQVGWAGASAYLKGQILYRIAEVLEGRASQFVEELCAQGLTGQSQQTPPADLAVSG